MNERVDTHQNTHPPATTSLPSLTLQPRPAQGVLQTAWHPRHANTDSWWTIPREESRSQDLEGQDHSGKAQGKRRKEKGGKYGAKEPTGRREEVDKEGRTSWAWR